MHDIGTLENRPFTITLVRMHSESWEDYVERCHQAANAVANLGPKVSDTALVHNLDALHGVTQVSEHAYEIETPGYQSKEEQSMHPLIARLSQATEHGRSLVEETPVDVEKLRACWKDEMLPAMLALWDELVRTDEDAHFIQRQIEDWEKVIPDMAEWPEQE